MNLLKLLWAKSIKRTSFSSRDIRTIPCSMYALVPQAMAQFAIKIEKTVPHFRDSRNAKNSALTVSVLIMAPYVIIFI